MCGCRQNPNPRMLMRKHDWETKPKDKIEVCCVMALMYVDEKEMAKQKVGIAAAIWLLQGENRGSVGGGVASVRPSESESAVSHAQEGCSACPLLPMHQGPAPERFVGRNSDYRRDLLLPQRLQHFPKGGKGSADVSFPYFSSSHHCSGLHSGYRFLFGKSSFISCGRWWLPSSHSHLLWIPLQVFTSWNTHPGSARISHLCSAMLSLEVSNTAS